MRAYNITAGTEEKSTSIIGKRGLLVREDGTYYLTEDGSFATGWVCDGDVFRYFDDDGRMRTDAFVETDGCTFYVDKEGVRFTGKLEKDGGEYYFDRSGRLILQ